MQTNNKKQALKSFKSSLALNPNQLVIKKSLLKLSEKQ